jgi:hypothetical protein
MSTPQLIGLHNYYNIAVQQLFGPFVLIPGGSESFLPNDRMLCQAGIPAEPAISAYYGAHHQLRANVLHFDRQWSPNMPMPPQDYVHLVHVCLAALPCLSRERDSRYIFALSLVLCFRMARCFSIYQHLIRIIKKTARRMGVELPPLAESLFARLEKEYAFHPTTSKVRSTFIVDPRLRHRNVGASTLESCMYADGGDHLAYTAYELTVITLPSTVLVDMDEMDIS